MRGLFPFVARFAKRKLGVGTTTIEDDEPRVWSAFDEVADRLADGRRYLCGDRFTAADLTFACLAAPVVAPPRYGTRLPQPPEMPAALAASVERFRAHPAGAFALRLYSERG
jgi:glutathione S-transferase